MMFSRPFLLIILLASLIAMPVAFYFLNDWLSTFAFSIKLPELIDVPLMAALVTLAVAMLTVVYQSLRLSKANPVQFLRNE